MSAPVEGGTRRGPVIGSLLMPVLVAATLAGPPRSPAGPTVNISRMTGNQAETAVAVNPTDPSNIVVTSNLETFAGLLEGYSTDGGRTWSTRIIADGRDSLGLACCDSSLAFDQYGNLFLTYLLLSSAYLPVAVSADGGRHFHVIGKILPQLGPAGLRPRSLPDVSFPDQPTVTVGSGSVWVTFTGGLRIQAAGAAVSGLGQVGPFGPAEVAVGKNQGHFGDVAVGPDGKVLIVYQDQSGEGPGRIYSDLDPDGLGPAGFDPARLVTGTGVGDFDAIPAAARVTIDAEAGLAWDRTGGPHDGRVYLLWTQESPDESDDTDIMVQASDDDGATWSPAARVNDDSGTNSQFDPKIALDQSTGDVSVAWYDCRNDLGTGGQGDTNGIPNDDVMVYATLSRDGGATFSDNLPVSVGVSNAEDAGWGLDVGDYEGMAFQSGSFFYVWADNSNSTGDNPDGALHQMDVYTARVRVP